MILHDMFVDIYIYIYIVLTADHTRQIPVSHHANLKRLNDCIHMNGVWVVAATWLVDRYAQYVNDICVSINTHDGRSMVSN
jgi:hypothetical protein